MAGELELACRGTLADWTERLATASSEELTIEVAPLRGVLNLRGAPADQSLVTDVQRAAGIELPMAPNRWHGDDRAAAIWLGPDEWLLIAPDGEAADIEAALRGVRTNDPWLSLVDVSHSYACLALSGPLTRDLLAKGLALDLHPRAFSSGDCAQTILGKSRVLLRALDGDHSFEVWVRNSLACYAAAWLLDACAAFCER